MLLSEIRSRAAHARWDKDKQRDQPREAGKARRPAAIRQAALLLPFFPFRAFCAALLALIARALADAFPARLASSRRCSGSCFNLPHARIVAPDPGPIPNPSPPPLPSS